ncbi:class I SAM-dependent methyltransferase [Apibacter raozihei]|uniref:class I SAM-dependent methyltransferase n=1 Tax=Apibacter raozihei TaxID=2500547 RepID=UPI000FE3AB09|nr:class I SAM-dependent methyltransferase [Apibacter raozihei]
MDTKFETKQYWENEYKTITQFDGDEPDRWIKALEKENKIKGMVLDSGCGSGRTSVYLAKLGYDVTGVDISSNAINKAKNKLKTEKLTFHQGDICEFSEFKNCFDTIIDIGCFHSIMSHEDCLKYTQNLFRISKPKSRIYLRAFSDKNIKQNSKMDKPGLPAISEQKIRTCFPADFWNIVQCEEKEIDLLVYGNLYKKGYCWFVEIECKKR